MIQQAMIFAAGAGQRMGALTCTCPKPLLKLLNRPLLDWQLERLALAGVQRVVINTHYLAVQFHQWARQRTPTPATAGLEIVFSDEQQALETGGGLLQALPLLDDAPFWLINADVWFDALPVLNAASAVAFLSDRLGHLWLVPNPSHHPEGDFLLSSPSLAQATRLTFSGCSLMTRAIMAPAVLCAAYGQYPAAQQAFKLAPLLHYLIEQGQISTSLYSGHWVDIGTPERLSRLEHRLKRLKGNNA